MYSTVLGFLWLALGLFDIFAAHQVRNGFGKIAIALGFWLNVALCRIGLRQRTRVLIAVAWGIGAIAVYYFSAGR